MPAAARCLEEDIVLRALPLKQSCPVTHKLQVPRTPNASLYNRHVPDRGNATTRVTHSSARSSLYNRHVAGRGAMLTYGF